jgi:ADP-ribose pyrophosphatase YjhB (NUDIX family)
MGLSTGTALDGDRPAGVLARGPWDPAKVSVRWSEQPYEPDDGTSAAADAALAKLGERGSPTHDGLGARVAGYEQGPDGIVLDMQPVRWALRLASDAVDSISALCVVRDAEGRWLAGRRAPWVASWAGRWALGAGGAVEVGENPAETLARELAEEWSVTPERLSAEALVRLPAGLLLFVGLAHLPAGAEVTIDPEHDAHAWWPPEIGDWPEEADAPLRLMATMLAGG